MMTGGELGMAVVIVRWQIHPDDEVLFVESWNNEFVPSANGLIHEFLTKIDTEAPDDLRTLALNDTTYVTYLTIGFWSDVLAFKEAIRNYRSRTRYSFRCGTLDRLALATVSDRMGRIPFPPPRLIS
jgi:hypothetical protein